MSEINWKQFEEDEFPAPHRYRAGIKYGWIPAHALDYYTQEQGFKLRDERYTASNGGVYYCVEKGEAIQDLDPRSINVDCFVWVPEDLPPPKAAETAKPAA